MIYFDNGATSFPKPPSVAQGVEKALRLYGANPGRSGHRMAIDTAIQVFECRELAAEFFHAAAPEDVVFTQNCTHALNIVMKGLLKQGDHVIMSDLEHNSVLRPVHALARRGYVTYSVAPTSADDDETVAAFEQLIRPNTRLIACTHGSNVFGFKLPIEKLAQMAHKNDVLFLVDAAQTAGVLEIDVQKTGIDFLCTAGHKSLYGPSGTGILITQLGNVMETLMEGGSGSMSQSYDPPDTMPERMESGTLNTMGILGLREGISFVKKTGVEKIYLHEMHMAEEIHRCLSSIPQVQLYTSKMEAGRNLPVISFNIHGKSSEETVALLDEKGFALRGGLHCAPLAHNKMGTSETGTARISIGVFNNMQQAQRLCSAIKKICR